MTLHEAIVKVLTDVGHALSAGAIAAEINERGLYNRRDRAPVPPNQIAARVRVKAYADRFVVVDGLIDLAGRTSAKRAS